MSIFIWNLKVLFDFLYNCHWYVTQWSCSKRNNHELNSNARMKLNYGSNFISRINEFCLFVSLVHFLIKSFHYSQNSEKAFIYLQCKHLIFMPLGKLNWIFIWWCHCRKCLGIYKSDKKVPPLDISLSHTNTLHFRFVSLVRI